MLKVSLATSFYDRTAPLHDGRVSIEGCETNCLLIDVPGEIFHRAFKYEEFDIAEISLSSHMLTTARGDAKYIGIPAFPSRKFRHSNIYIRTDRGIRGPEDLRGKIIGVPEYQQTANVWMRGILDDEYCVDLRSVRWRTGGRDEPGRQERAKIMLSKEIDWQIIPAHCTLSNMLENGDLDAIISPLPPLCFARKERCPQVDYLFPDYPSVELDYFKKTNIFPIMHLVGIRKSLAEANPWLPVNVFKAFLKAKALINYHNSTMLPWANAVYKNMQKLLGDDYWSYHLEPNRHVIQTFAQYAIKQGLIDRPIAPEELFHPATLDLSKS